MHPFRLAFLLALVSAAVPFCRAQEETTAEPTARDTVLHTTTNLVLVDVVVTDKGKAIHGLDRSRSHVFEDGHEQLVVSFDEHQLTTTADPARRPSMFPDPLPASTFSNFPAHPESSAVNVLMLDESNTPKQDWEYLRRQIVEYLGTATPGTPLAIFALTANLRMVQGFTSDVGQTIKALQNMKPEDFGAHLTDQEKLIKPGVRTRVRQHNHDPLTDERPQITMEATQHLARYLSLIPGRKNLIWFAGTFPVALDPGATLSAAHVAVYPVDARGMMSLPGSHASNLYDREDLAGVKANEESTERTKAEHAAMEQFAEQTGGQAYFNTNGLKEVMASAVENGSSYYTIGYVPAAGKLDGKFRNIKLRLNNAGYELAYRRGYYAASPGQQSAQDSQQPSLMTESVVHGAPPATLILFQARVLPATDPLLRGTNVPAGPAGEMAADLKGPVQLTIVDLTLDSHTLTLNETPEDTHQARVTFTLVAYDTTGKRVNYLFHGVQLNIEGELYARIMAEGVPVRLALDLPEGQISLRIAVHDQAAGGVGSLEVPVTVANEGSISGGGSPAGSQLSPSDEKSAIPSHPALDRGRSSVQDEATTYIDLPVRTLREAVPVLKGLDYDDSQDQLPSILTGVGQRIADVMLKLPDLTSREVVYHFQSPRDPRAPGGLASLQPWSREYNYLLLCRHYADGSTKIEESRADSKGHPVRASGLFTDPHSYGFAYQWLLFSAANQPEFRFRYLGRQDTLGRATYVLAFAQVPKRVTDPAYFESLGKAAPFYYQGILWIDRASFDIVMLRTDLLAPLPDLHLGRLTTELHFSSVPIHGYDAEFWLPSEIDVISFQGAGRAVETHRYSDYHIFHAEAKIVPEP